MVFLSFCLSPACLSVSILKTSVSLSFSESSTSFSRHQVKQRRLGNEADPQQQHQHRGLCQCLPSVSGVDGCGCSLLPQEEKRRRPQCSYSFRVGELNPANLSFTHHFVCLLEDRFTFFKSLSYNTHMATICIFIHDSSGSYIKTTQKTRH